MKQSAVTLDTILSSTIQVLAISMPLGYNKSYLKHNRHGLLDIAAEFRSIT